MSLGKSPRRTKPYKALSRNTPGAVKWRSKPRKAMNKVSKKGRAKMAGRRNMLDWYFKKAFEEKKQALCQICGTPLRREFAEYHHKILRSHGGKETLENGLACHGTCHIMFLHDGILGMPVSPSGIDRITKARVDTANLKNAEIVDWSAQQRLDLDATIRRWGK